MKGKKYYLFARGLEEFEDEAVFYQTMGEEIAKSLCELFKKEYGASDEVLSFSYKEAESIPLHEKYHLQKLLDCLAHCDGNYSTVPDHKLKRIYVCLAHFGIRARTWEEALRDIQFDNQAAKEEAHTGVSLIDEKTISLFKTDSLNLEYFANASTLAIIGKRNLNKLLEPFKEHLTEAGFILPNNNLEEEKYFAEMACILKSKDKLLKEFTAEIDKFLEQARISLESHNNETVKYVEKGFRQRHIVSQIKRKQYGRELMSLMAKCDHYRWDYPDGLTPEQQGIVVRLRLMLDENEAIFPDPIYDMRLEHDITETIKDLENVGLVVFAGSYSELKEHGNQKAVLKPISIFSVTYYDYSKIQACPDGSKFINATIPIHRKIKADDNKHDTSKDIKTIGKFQYRLGFEDVWIDDIHFDLRTRNKARFVADPENWARS